MSELTERRCYVCGVTKPISEYNRAVETYCGGYAIECKECKRKRNKEYYLKNREKCLQKYSDYAKSDKGRKVKYASFLRSYHKEPEKQRARVKVYYAIKTGKLIKDPCSVCGDIKSQAHHHDYSKPLEVIWLCMTHHKQIEGKSVIARIIELPIKNES